MGDKFRQINRRQFKKFVAGGLLSPWVSRASQAFSTVAPESSNVFSLGVASGDPTATGFIIWTRLDPNFIQGGAPLNFQVASDKDFFNIVVNGTIEPEDIREDRDYTIKVDLDGHLRPSRVFYYRYEYGGAFSAIGRGRTLPEADAALNHLNLGVFSCQDLSSGRYTAFRHLVETDKADYVVHLGDFIYEKCFQDTCSKEIGRLPSGLSVARDLQDFRHLYRTYRKDKDLQNAMRQFTWMMIWDDHETANDCYWDYENDTMAAPNHPFSTELEGAEKAAYFNQLKLDAQKAWNEYTPTRPKLSPEGTHPHENLTIYRDFKFGKLGYFCMTDSRTYRTKPELQNGFMLGNSQSQWLKESFENSRATWKILGNETFFSPFGVNVLGRPTRKFNTDAWDGYVEERQELLDFWVEKEMKNLVILTGDMHSSVRSKVMHRGVHLGWEYMVPAVSSKPAIQFLRKKLKKFFPQKDFWKNPESFIIKNLNRHIKFFDARRNGYGLLSLSCTASEMRYYAVDSTNPDNYDQTEVIHRFSCPSQM